MGSLQWTKRNISAHKFRKKKKENQISLCFQRKRECGREREERNSKIWRSNLKLINPRFQSQQIQQVHHDLEEFSFHFNAACCKIYSFCQRKNGDEGFSSRLQLGSNGHWTHIQRRKSLRYLLSSSQGAHYLHQWPYFWRYCPCCGCSASLPRVWESLEAHQHVPQLPRWRRHCWYFRKTYVTNSATLLFYLLS